MSGVLRRTIHSSSFLHCCKFRLHATLQSVTKCDADFSKNLYVNVALIVVNFPGHAYDAFLLSPFRGAELRFDSPCQDAGEGFGFQEESKVVAPTWHAYCFEFGVPCDCSQGFTAGGHFPTIFICCYVDTPCIRGRPPVDILARMCWTRRRSLQFHLWGWRRRPVSECHSSSSRGSRCHRASALDHSSLPVQFRSLCSFLQRRSSTGGQVG